MRTWIKMVLVSVLGLWLWGGASARAQTAAEQMGVHEADGWLALVDSGHYAESWEAASAVFKAAVTAEKWEAAMKQVREPLGKMQSRVIQSATRTPTLPGQPDGDYVVLLYQSSFEHKAQGQETVILSREKDGVLRVSGYYIK